MEVAEIQGILNQVLGRYCGVQIPDDVVSTFNFVTVIYTASKGSHAHSGFHASLLLVPAGKRLEPSGRHLFQSVSFTNILVMFT